jgi:hypothetical protein
MRVGDHQYQALIALGKNADVWWFRLLEEETTNQMALMIADAYTRVGDNDASVKRLSEIVDRAPHRNGEGRSVCCDSASGARAVKA